MAPDLTPADKVKAVTEWKMERVVNGEVVDTHGVYQLDWEQRHEELEAMGWRLVPDA